MHIHMSYCSYPALKILLKNYLGIEDGDLSDRIMEELQGVVEKAKITPADVSEVLIRYRREKMRAVTELLKEMKNRRERKSGGNEDEEQEKRELEMHNRNAEKIKTDDDQMVVDDEKKFK